MDTLWTRRHTNSSFIGATIINVLAQGLNGTLLVLILYTLTMLYSWDPFHTHSTKLNRLLRVIIDGLASTRTGDGGILFRRGFSGWGAGPQSSLSYRHRECP